MKLIIQILAAACTPAGYAECISAEHKPAGCSGQPILVGTSYGHIEYFIEDVVSSKEYGPWHTNGAQNPGWYPCGTRTALSERVITYSETREVCWKVSGSATIEVKSGLASSLVAEVGASVTIGTELSKCRHVTETHTWSIAGAHCYNTRGREEVTVNSVEGYVEEHEAMFVWQCYIAGTGTGLTSEVRTTFCGTSRADGDAQSFGRGNQIAPRPADCGGAIPSPDPFGGVRSDPWCRPLIDCGDSIPPGGHECCGCYGNP